MKALQASQWFPVCKFKDLASQEGICALVDGQQVAIFYLPEEQQLFAIGNWDPIGKANILSRGIIGDINGELVVASPLYKQHFSLKTGKCLEDETVSVPVYEVAMDGDDVVVGIGQG